MDQALNQKIDAYIAENKEQLLQDIAALVAIDSVEGTPEEGAPFGAGPRAALDKTLELAAGMGFATRNCENYIGYAELAGADPEKYLATICHVDVVPVGNGWTADPFKMRIQDGWLLGRGVSDDKGPMIVTLYALKFLKEQGYQLRYPIRAIVGDNEETHMNDVKYYLENYPAPVFCFTPDAEFPVCNGEKGHFGGKIVSPVQTASDDFVEQSLSERASERRARKVACILLAAAVLSCVAFLLFGGGINCAVAAAAAVLCMGAPLSSVLVPGLAALRLQRAAAAVGAVVPGWAAIEELGGIDTIELDADDLFTADSVTLEDIRIFKGGRIDRAILYAASVLNESCDTLRGLFSQIIEDRIDILFPVKDLEQHIGLGFSAWCDNNRILIGTRRYMEQEGVTLPEQDYEDGHSKNGELQILYLAVSGNLHAMFVLRYVGGRNVARSLASLQRENIRLLVTSKDPSLTARHITEAYHLPEGMVTVLDGDQCQAIEAADAAPEKPDCCLYHHRGFASLTGGLQAADQAQNAETSATTVQLVSVCFSVFIAVLLTYAGSIWQLSIATVLMYQAAWSALSIAVCALKQHS